MELEFRDTIRDSIEKLGPWLHNVHLPDGIQTVPDHFLGDYPAQKWKQIEPLVPKDLKGWRCLDIGCNAGFYSFELAKRGAHVVGIDSDPHYLQQAVWISRNFFSENPPEFLRMQVHELARVSEKYDLVLFMDVFDHLRYPLLALDTVSELVERLMIFETPTAVETLLRSTGFEKIDRVAHEIYFCWPPSDGVRRNRKWSHAEWEAATGSKRH